MNERFDDSVDVAEAILGCGRPLLIASDVDGTLSPIAARPGQARLAPEALSSLLALAGRADIEVAVVSGRSLDELVQQFGFPPTLHLVGSHGAEIDHGEPLDGAEQAVMDDVVAGLTVIAGELTDARLEHKPYAVALHVRGATPDAASRALAAARERFAGDARVHVHEGHQVYELAVRHTTKGTALATLRERLRPTAVVFFGDDRSDETAFTQLGIDDVGVKIGPGPTAARWRLGTPADVVDVLERLTRQT
ncbi:MAG: trehalose-phosphatase [Ilumatobacteraceae bacterium]